MSMDVVDDDGFDAGDAAADTGFCAGDGAAANGAVVDGAVVEGAVVNGAVVDGAEVNGAEVDSFKASDGAVAIGAVADGAVVDTFTVDNGAVLDNFAADDGAVAIISLPTDLVEADGTKFDDFGAACNKADFGRVSFTGNDSGRRTYDDCALRSSSSSLPLPSNCCSNANVWLDFDRFSTPDGKY